MGAHVDSAGGTVGATHRPVLVEVGDTVDLGNISVGEIVDIVDTAIAIDLAEDVPVAWSSSAMRLHNIPLGDRVQGPAIDGQSPVTLGGEVTIPSQGAETNNCQLSSALSSEKEKGRGGKMHLPRAATLEALPTKEFRLSVPAEFKLAGRGVFSVSNAGSVVIVYGVVESPAVDAVLAGMQDSAPLSEIRNAAALGLIADHFPDPLKTLR